MFSNYSQMAFAYADPTHTLGVREEQSSIGHILKVQEAYLSKHNIQHQFESYLRDVVALKQLCSQKDLFFFTFSGHADQNIQLEHGSLNFEPLQDYFTNCLHLKCVFLNGCNTCHHINLFHQSNVPIVIASKQHVADRHAIQFSVEFFRAFVQDGFTLMRAYEIAKEHLLSMQTITIDPFQEVAVNRGQRLEEEDQHKELFGLYYIEEDRQLLDLTLDQLARRDPAANPLLREGPKYQKFFFIGLENEFHRREDILPLHYYREFFSIDALDTNPEFTKRHIREYLEYIGQIVLIIQDDEQASRIYASPHYIEVLELIRDADTMITVIILQKDGGVLATIRKVFQSENSRIRYLPSEDYDLSYESIYSEKGDLNHKAARDFFKQIYQKEAANVADQLSRLNFKASKMLLQQLFEDKTQPAANLIVIEGDDILESGWEILVRYLFFLHKGKYRRPLGQSPMVIDTFDGDHFVFNASALLINLLANLKLRYTGEPYKDQQERIVGNLFDRLRHETAHYWIIKNVTSNDYHVPLTQIWQDLSARIARHQPGLPGKLYWIWLKNDDLPIPGLEDPLVRRLPLTNVAQKEEKDWVHAFNENNQLRHIQLTYQHSPPMSVKHCIRKYCASMRQEALENEIFIPSKPY